MDETQRPMAAYHVAVAIIAFLGVMTIIRGYGSTFHVVVGTAAVAAAVVLAILGAVRRK